MFISCHNCKNPQARSLGYEIPDSYKGKAPDIVFRFATEEEFDMSPEALQDHLEAGGLFMEVVSK